MCFNDVESAKGSHEAINFGLSLIHVSFALFLISFMEESASHPTSAFPEAECPKFFLNKSDNAVLVKHWSEE